MLKINKDNYQYYKSIFSIIWEFQAECANIDKNVDYSPINVLNSWEKESISKAQKGLKAGLLDALTEIKDLPQNYLSDLNKKLLDKGFPKIEMLISEIKNIPEKVLKRGRILNIAEYYVIKEVLDDVENNMNIDSRNKLSDLFAKFENIKNNKNNVS